jgi:translation initiation factor 2 alpha subunit (eIF-2alpha)
MVNYDLEEGQIVLCTVDKILGTTVFVKIQDNGEGTVTTSEISPGRIRNLRDYVVPGKKIVCKVLSIRGDKVYLSLRRVKQNEKKELLDKISKERSYKAILKTVLGKEESEELIEKITNDYSITDFFEEIKTNPKILDKYTQKSDSEKIMKILDSKKEKPKEIRQIFKLSSDSSDGINKSKKILQESCKGTKCDISYLAAGKYRLSITGPDFKEIKSEVNSTLDSIEKQARKQDCEFSLEKN